MFDMGISDTVKEHEQDMNALMRRIKGKGCELKDPFIMVDKTKKYPIYDEATHWKLKKPKLGEKFVNMDQFKECLTYYALANGFSLWYETSSKYMVISLKDEHTCVRNYNYGTLINYKWLGKHFGDKIRVNPHIRLIDISDLVMKKYNCIVSPNQYRRAKSYALSEGECSLQDHYGLLRSYAKAITDSNVGSTVKVGVTVNHDEKTYFDRFYVCLKGLKEGWKLGCRKIIALDDCFLKKPNCGEILTAVGRDGNNQIYPVTWAIVTVENKDNWSWFLSLLGDDLDLPTGCGLTLISDQHKGLIEAVKEVMPYAEHRQCARHIYEGFRKQYSGVEFRQLFWAASKASYPHLFNKIMENIKKDNPKAHEYLSKKDPKSWSRAFFREGANCEAVENRFWHVIPAGESKFKVRKRYDAFIVDEAANTCSCRMWQISGLPCVHAVACIFKLNKMVEPYVPKCFKIEMFKQAYTQFMNPVEGITFWSDCTHLSRILGPLPKKMPGQNKKGCKNDPIPKTPKVKGKAGRPKKIIPTENTNLVDDEDFSRNWNQNKRGGKSGGTCFVKMRGGKSSRGGLVPTKRLGRIKRWLGADAATSDPIDPIEDTQPFQRSQVGTNFNVIDAGTSHGPKKTLGVKLTRGKHSRSAFIGSTSSSPRVARQTMTEPAPQEQPNTQEPPPAQSQVRRRQQAHMPPREKSQRILLKKVSQKIIGPE
ncbi:pentatricopeptide repeat-containing protein [Tanacetum coccineum]